jgi:hypothetical protein
VAHHLSYRVCSNLSGVYGRLNKEKRYESKGV